MLCSWQQLSALRLLGLLLMLVVCGGLWYITGQTHAIWLQLVVVSLYGYAAFVLYYLYKKKHEFTLKNQWLTVVQWGIDWLSWTAFMACTGGSMSPLVLVYFVLLAVYTPLLPLGFNWLHLIASFTAYVLGWVFYNPLPLANHQLQQLHLFSMFAVFIGGALLIMFVVQGCFKQNSTQKNQIHIQQQQIKKMDWLAHLGSMASSAAHDISSPLATMMMIQQEMSADPSLPLQYQHDLLLVEKQIKRCKQALKRMTLRAGLSVHQQAHSRFGLWIQDFCLDWQHSHTGIVVDIQLSPDLNNYILMVENTFESALLNFLDNAYKANASQIVIVGHVVQDRYELRIEDNGNGFLPETVLAFNSFEAQPSQQGLGIGLLLCKANIERMGGHVQLYDVNPKGAGILLDMPL